MRGRYGAAQGPPFQEREPKRAHGRKTIMPSRGRSERTSPFPERQGGKGDPPSSSPVWVRFRARRTAFPFKRTVLHYNVIKDKAQPIRRSSRGH